MSNKIEIDVLQAVQDFYPGLSIEDAILITQEITSNWDYSEIYNQIQDDILWYVQEHDIDITGKDGVTETEEESNNVYVLNPPPSRLFGDNAT